MNVYNASPVLPNNVFTSWKPMNWWPSNNLIFNPQPDGSPPQLRDDFDARIMELPDLFTGFNLERLAEGSYEYLDYSKHPQDCVELYTLVTERVRHLRPELDFVIYGMGGGSAQAQKYPDEFLLTTMQREMDLREATQHMSSVAFSAYWNSSWLSFEDWIARQSLGYSIASSIHRKRPVAFVWDGDVRTSDRGSTPLTYTEFQRVLKWCAAHEMDIVYWSHWGANTRLDNIRWSTQWGLYEYSR